MVALGDVLSLSLAPQRVEPERRYPALGVYGFGRGVITDKPAVRGADIAASVLFEVKSGQFIYSRLKAFEGAFAVVPDKADGHFVTNEFPTFDCNPERLDAAYLAWLFRLPATWAKLSEESKGVGARRERVHPEALVSLRIPLPSVAEQRRIVGRLDSAADCIVRRAAAAKSVEVELAAMLQVAFRRMTAGAPVTRLGDIAPLKRRPVTTQPGAVYREVGARSFGRGLFHKPDLSANDLTWQQLFRVEQGDLVFSNIKAWEGAFAVANASNHGCVGSHRYLTCVPDSKKATPGFLCFYLQSPVGISKVQAASPGSADRNRTLSSRALADIRVPVPSLDVQNEFDCLQAKARGILAAQREATSELDRLLPALVREVFMDCADALPRAIA